MIRSFRSTSPLRRAGVLLCTAAAGLAPWAAALGATTSGSVLSEVGNQGNVASTQYVATTGPGTFSAGPLTGSSGANTTQGQIDVAYNPTGLPGLTASATGTVQSTSLDGAFTSINVDVTYDFIVNGTAGTLVPILFSGITDGTLASQGDPNRLYGEVGNRVRIVSQNIAGTFAPVGAQSGTGPDYYASNAGMVNLGWGSQAAGPVGYTDYASGWTWGADLIAGQTATITLSTSLRGGTTGQLRGLAELTSSTATSFIDPYIYIDPDWLAVHPGFSVTVEPDIGNVGPTAVPEPRVALLLAAGLGVLLIRRQQRRGG